MCKDMYIQLSENSSIYRVHIIMLVLVTILYTWLEHAATSILICKVGVVVSNSV